MAAITTKSDWSYEVCVIKGNAWQDRHYTGITYTDKKDATKALLYYGRGFVEAKRHVEIVDSFKGSASCGWETLKVHVLN